MKNLFTQAASCRRSIATTVITTIACGSFLFLFAVPTQSFAVTYAQGKINGDSDVLNLGTQIRGVNLGANATAVTINGMAFSANDTTGLTGFAPSGPVDISTQFAPGSGLDTILSEDYFQDFFVTFASLQFTGLTQGNEYLFQIFLSNEPNGTSKSSRVTVQGQDYNLFDYGTDADYIRVDFFASGATENIQFGTGSSDEAFRMQLNAYTLSAVPEPSTFALGGIGLAALAWLRRFRAGK